MDILLAIDQERERQGLTKQELAKRAGLQPAAVRRVFLGQSNPTLSTLSALTAALRCDVNIQTMAGTVDQSAINESQSEAYFDLAKRRYQKFSTVLADPPWRFQNRTGKVAPEHKRLSRYDTMTLEEICALPVSKHLADKAHLYLWVPNALIADGLRVMKSWGFTYKANIVWAKRRKDGGPDGRGVGFYFRNVTELVLFGTRGSMRTLAPGRRQVNMLETRKREHSRKPDEMYDIIEQCSPGPYLEMFARYPRKGWSAWGNEACEKVEPRGKQHAMYKGGKVASPQQQTLY